MGRILSESHAGPDDPIYKGGLRVSSVLGPSALIKNSPKSMAGEKPASAASDPMLPAMNGMEAAMLEQAAYWNKRATEQDSPEASQQGVSDMPDKNEPV